MTDRTLAAKAAIDILVAKIKLAKKANTPDAIKISYGGLAAELNKLSGLGEMTGKCHYRNIENIMGIVKFAIASLNDRAVKNTVIPWLEYCVVYANMMKAGKGADRNDQLISDTEEKSRRRAVFDYDWTPEVVELIKLKIDARKR